MTTVQELLDALAWCFTAQMDAVDAWHAVEAWHGAEPERAELASRPPSLDLLKDLVLDEHLTNFQLWHVEDEARRDDAGLEYVVQCKRRIDGLNQSRNNGIEAVDACLVALLAPLLPKDAEERYNTETVGGALDRLSILSLKRYHMAEQMNRPGASAEHKAQCGRKLAVMEAQHADLCRAVLELVEDYGQGRKQPKVYYQFKMYNDPELNPQLYGRKDTTT